MTTETPGERKSEGGFSEESRKEALHIRAASPEDAPSVAAILTEAFPALYQATFGKLSMEKIAQLLTELYRAGHLSLEATRLCEREGRVVGLAILHRGDSIGRGSALHFGRLLLKTLGLWPALRAFCGGLSTNIFLNRRIPHAPDLIYIEALAVLTAERGRGVGTLLLADAETWTRAQGRSRLALHVLLTNTKARRLYERLGFRPWHAPTQQGLLSRSRSHWTALLLARTLEEARTDRDCEA